MLISRRLTAEESLNLSVRLYGEANYLREKRKIESNEFIKNNYSFRPNISNKDVPKVENFYLRLQDWMEIKHEKTRQ